MKTLYFTISFILICLFSQATDIPKEDLPVIEITTDVSVHFVSPEPIQFADISTDAIVGDIPVDNVLRVKVLSDSIASKLDETVVTIIGQSFIAQFNLKYVPENLSTSTTTRIEILPEHMSPLEFPDITMTFRDMKSISRSIVVGRKPAFNNVMSKALGMKAALNNIYAVGDYVFIDVSFRNRTRIKYDVDQFRFHIRDKRVTKATNVQDLEVRPVFSLYDNSYFRKRYRNVFVFRKFTFPGNKVFTIKMDEKQISGRSVELNIDYRDLLHADTL
ncbi:MAG: conjugative transposon protein TraN [Draconibacterium sp.]